MSQLKSRPALFLDRDGVLIEDAGYVKDPNKVKLISGVSNFLLRAQKKHNLLLCGVTNQSGIGRGWISIEDYKSVSAQMQKLLSIDEAFLDHILFAPYFSNSNVDLDLAGFSGELKIHFIIDKIEHTGFFLEHWRKPNIGMIEYAQNYFNICLQESFLVGDRLTDMQLAKAAGLKKFFLKKSHAFEGEKILIENWRDSLAENLLWYDTKVQVVEDYTEVDLS